MTNPTTRRAFLSAAGMLVGSAAAAQDPPLAPAGQAAARHPVARVSPARPLAGPSSDWGNSHSKRSCRRSPGAKLSKPVALVSGHPEKAKTVAAAYGIDPKAIYNYETYDQLAANPAVDVIYVVLPNSMHAEYTVRGVKAGKHVLCEKPMATSPAECKQMIDATAAAKKLLMIAYRLHYEPYNRAAIDICRVTKQLGKLKSITASNGQVTKAPNIRLSRALGGGPLQDVGIYCLNTARYLTGEEPHTVQATAHQPKDDPRFREVPESVFFTLRFPGGVVANCDCSFGTAESRRYRVQGDAGLLDLDHAFGYRGQRMTLTKAGQGSELKFREVDHFAAEMDHFSQCVLTGQPPRTPGEEGLRDMTVIAAINEAIRTGGAVKV